MIFTIQTASALSKLLGPFVISVVERFMYLVFVIIALFIRACVVSDLTA